MPVARDHQDLRRALEVELHHRVHLERAEARGKGDVLPGRELLVAEHHPGMLQAEPARRKQPAIPHALLGDERQAIVHIIGPELGITQPGMILVCGDSHTSPHGALGALAFGIGQSENEHVLATQALWQAPVKTLRILIEGARPPGVTAKDVILAIIAKIGAGGAVGHVIEYAGSAVRAMTIEERLTMCNMSIEAGARAGMVAPDDTTYQYLSGRPFA